MRKQTVWVGAALVVATAVGCAKSANPPVNPSEETARVVAPASESSASAAPQLSALDAMAVARDAYVFGVPLVYFSLQQGVMTNVAKLARSV